jgi:hypothetical protein
MTIREYAEATKQAVGTLVGAYEIIKTLPASDQGPAITSALLTVKDSGMFQGLPTNLDAVLAEKLLVDAAPFLEAVIKANPVPTP